MLNNANSGLNSQILEALVAEALSTPNLANAIQADRNRVYRRCRKLEEAGLLSHSKEGRPGLYCVDCKEAITSDNYQTCQSEGHDIRACSLSTCIWALTTQAQANADNSQTVH